MFPRGLAHQLPEAALWQLVATEPFWQAGPNFTAVPRRELRSFYETTFSFFLWDVHGQILLFGSYLFESVLLGSPCPVACEGKCCALRFVTLWSCNGSEKPTPGHWMRWKWGPKTHGQERERGENMNRAKANSLTNLNICG